MYISLHQEYGQLLLALGVLLERSEVAGVMDTWDTGAGGLCSFTLPSGANASAPCALRQLCRESLAFLSVFPLSSQPDGLQLHLGGRAMAVS